MGRSIWQMAILFVGVFFVVSGMSNIYAQDLNDEATDLEEINAESSAMRSILKTTHKKLEQKRAENDSKFSKVRKRRDAAAKRRDKLRDNLKQSEETLLKLEGEDESLRKELAQISSDTDVLVKDLEEQKAKISEAKKENVDLKGQREASRTRLKKLQKELAGMMREVGVAQNRAISFENETQDTIKREEDAVKELEKTKAEYVAEKVLLDQKVTDITAYIKQLKMRKTNLLREIANAKASSYRLREEVRMGNTRIRQLEDDAENQVMYDENDN